MIEKKLSRPKLRLVPQPEGEAQRLEALKRLNQEIRVRVKTLMDMVEAESSHVENLPIELLLELMRGCHHIEGCFDRGGNFQEFYAPLRDELNKRIREIFRAYVEAVDIKTLNCISKISINENYPWTTDGIHLVLYLPERYRFLSEKLWIPGVKNIEFNEETHFIEIQIDPLEFPFKKSDQGSTR